MHWMQFHPLKQMPQQLKFEIIEVIFDIYPIENFRIPGQDINYEDY